MPSNQRAKKGEYVLSFPLPATQKQSVKFVKGMRKLKVRLVPRLPLTHPLSLSQADVAPSCLQDIIAPTDTAGQEFADLCEGLLRWDQRQRLTVDQALAHPFFKKVIHDEGNPSP